MVVEEHHVVNENVGEQNEHFQGVLRLYLPATANDKIGRVLLREPMVTRGTWVPLLSVSKEPKGEILQQAKSISLVSVNVD